MNRTKDDLKLATQQVLHTGSVIIDATAVALKTPAALLMIEITNQLAEEIREVIKNAVSVEQLIRQEQVLQQVDELSAQTEGDRASVKFAKTDYVQLSLIVRQMLGDPEAYILNNVMIKETRADYRKQPKSRGPQQIRANKERLADRAAFSPKELREIWNARIELADKTEAMLRELHDSVVANQEEPDYGEHEI